MVTASDDPPAGRRSITPAAEKRIRPPPPAPPHPHAACRSRRSSLHNFSFPSNLGLSWGNQRVLRCVNPNPRPSNPEEPAAAAAAAAEEEESSPANLSRPWNLRSWRASGRVSSPPSPRSPTMVSLGKSLRPRAENGGGGGGGERSKFSVGLSKEEIEEDFVKMKGSKPPRRPKKRAKYIQKQLDSVFPGLWLSEITADLYKIDEVNFPLF
ncbi:uncharacterized protein M6B38_191935 [Iris pallida]|uniref:DUF1639 family protein n=1 Tax=Iris pallida TaxID=29817 RepID=A0AAX6EF76_IRIPA|nr:uncharacterized protein M6B38_191935 [Iris pallida]